MRRRPSDYVIVLTDALFRVKKGGVLAYNSGLYNDTDFMSLAFNLLPPAPYELYRPFLPKPSAGMMGAPPITQHEHMFYHESKFNSIVDGYRKLCSGTSTASSKQFLIQHRIDTRAKLRVSTSSSSPIHWWAVEAY